MTEFRFYLSDRDHVTTLHEGTLPFILGAA